MTEDEFYDQISGLLDDLVGASMGYWDMSSHPHNYIGDINARLLEAKHVVKETRDRIMESIKEWNTRADGWIPASEPPKNTKSIIVYDGTTRGEGYYNGKWFWIDGYESAVTHWQELPKPPRR